MAEDLAGLKVSHDFEALNEGEDRILTLKDSRILDNEGPYYLFASCISTPFADLAQRTSSRMSSWLKMSEQKRITS